MLRSCYIELSKLRLCRGGAVTVGQSQHTAVRSSHVHRSHRNARTLSTNEPPEVLPPRVVNLIPRSFAGMSIVVASHRSRFDRLYALPFTVGNTPRSPTCLQGVTGLQDVIQLVVC